MNPKTINQKITHEDGLFSYGLVPGFDVKFSNLDSVFAFGLLFGIFITIVFGESWNLVDCSSSSLNGSGEAAIFGLDLQRNFNVVIF